MYEDYYRLKEKPFSLTPDPRFLYLSKHHQGALDHMLYGIRQREGFMTIVGDVGTGKTTLCRCLLDRLDKNIQVALILNPMLSDIDLLKTCINDLNIQPSRLKQKISVSGSFSETDSSWSNMQDPSWINRLSKKELIDLLNLFLLQQHAEGRFTVLIIDEAQNLSFEVMEQLRILSNLETEREKLIQIIFVGQLELNDKLNQPELKQLNQRISIRYQITPLPKDETRNYINHRLMVAGASSRICFSNSSLNSIYNYSKGYPRLINLVCDRGLLSGFNAQTDTIDSSHVKQGIQSLLGSEDQNYFLIDFLKNRLPIVGSLLFFLGGLLFFWLGINNSEPAREQETSSAENRHASVNTSLSAERETTGKISTAVVSGIDGGHTNIRAKTYRIQVYAMSNLGSAEESTLRLEEEGYPAYWKKVKISGKHWHIVYIGPYNSKQKAQNDVQILKQTGRNPILLTKIPSS